MTPSRIASWLFVAAVAGAWFASAAGVVRPVRQPRTPPRSPETVALDNLVADVQTQATRLRKRLETAPAPTAPFRNPFSFAERRAPVVRGAQAAAAVTPVVIAPPPAVPAEPPLQLIGIAEKKVGDTIVRTAMMSPGNADALIMATAGQTILGTYEVVAISGDAVELRDLVTGETRRLLLKQL